MKLLVTIIVLCALSATGCNNFEMQQPTDVLTNESIKIECGYDEFLNVANTYPHNAESFTQGLFFHDGILYESTGLYGKSKLYKNINIENGTAEKEYAFANDIFAEGSVILNGNLYVLTYKENKVFKFTPETLEPTMVIPYSRQGWGLATDGEYLIASDGSSEIYFMDEKLNDIKQITVTHKGKEVSNINELEYIDGFIWANEWLTNNILIIDPNSGNVVKLLDFTKLCPDEIADTNDVLNGIAYNSQTGKIYITGKRWDKLYELELKK